MNGLTHAAGGVVAGCLIGAAGTEEPLGWLMAASAAGALIPDIDTPHSRIQKYIPGAGAVVGHTLRHRGVTHSLAFTAAMYVLLTFTLPVPGVYIKAFAAGMISHLLLDSLNPMGVPWMWPLPGRFGIPLVSSSGLLEKLVIMPGMMAAALYMLWQFAKGGGSLCAHFMRVLSLF